MQNSYIEELSCCWTDFKDRYSRIGGYITTPIRWLLTLAMPVVIGGYFDYHFQKYIASPSEFILGSLKYSWPALVALLLYILTVIWRSALVKRDLHTSNVYLSITWLYYDLGLEKDEAADYRCTVWIPTNSRTSVEKMKLLQIIDYFPPFENGNTPIGSYRKNKNRGRIRNVAWVDKRGNIRPIGLLGHCAFNCIDKREASIMVDNIRDAEDFDTHMLKENFTGASVKRLNRDRRSYMCIPLMDISKTDILGLIYIDAKKPFAFEGDIKKKIQPYLPRVAESLIAKGGKDVIV